MKVFALDVETTGLDVATDQVLEVAVVVDDLQVGVPARPFAELPTFRGAIYRTRVTGSPAALAMNAALLERISKRPAATQDTLPVYPSELSLAANLDWFLTSHRSDQPITVVGFNVWKLDIPILRKMMAKTGSFLGEHHRAIEVGSLYARPEDQRVPSSQECCSRAGRAADTFGPDHDPVIDCHRALFCLRHHWGFQ